VRHGPGPTALGDDPARPTQLLADRFGIVFLDRLGRLEPAAAIAGFAFGPLSTSVPRLSTAITHLRDVLSEAAYESLARQGEKMTTAEMVAYAYDQIDQARTELNAVSG